MEPLQARRVALRILVMLIDLRMDTLTGAGMGDWDSSGCVLPSPAVYLLLFL